MPPRAPLPRSLHLPTGPKPKVTPRKPHLSKLHLDSALLAPAAESLPFSSAPPFVPPAAPQIPPRRRPAFSPGGFGLTSREAPKATDILGLGRRRKPVEAATGDSKTEAEIERRRAEIAKDEAAQEGSKPEGEAEACYVPPPTTLHYHSPGPLPLVYSDTPLPPHQLAYETWGTLNEARDNAIILHTGLSASSHVASGGNDVAHATSSKPGWWEDFVGPDKPIDTNRFFVICTNVLGGCFGSTGPSSPYPPGDGQVRWATRFPMLSIHDMTRAQLGLLDYLGIDKLYACIGSSMGGMSSLSMTYLAPERVGRVASISATGRSGLNGVGMRYAQRSVLMADPNWNRGFYYDGIPPHEGMKLARQIATITYRSGPEWEQRFGRRMLSEEQDGGPGTPRLSPDFLIETYLDHQGERFCLTYDANSLIYLSKAMDLFDMTAPALEQLAKQYNERYPDAAPFPLPSDPPAVSAADNSPRPGSVPIPEESSATKKAKERFIPTSKSVHLPELAAGLKRLKDIPALILGVQSDVLFNVEQQRELADALKLAGNRKVAYYELGGVWGHDTFLLDVQSVGGAIRGFLM
ncbi:Serine O-succinyltransferase [Vanrija pseudolonga]|uniref:Serine O-succinyltransferase n=1 Tax=Vanrija pseudolonga TaxID=143232 RepID=A0AAF0YL71_9TREE|nr:Serine O-succinyltransferase [Vanrija pseudolonga]